MGNDNINTNYNEKGDVDLQLSLDKVCFCPGEKINGKIIITPKFGLFQECKNYSILNIIITQHSHYIYPAGSDYETEQETLTLLNQKYQFSDFIESQDEITMNVLISFILPINARPSIFINSSDYVRHILTIEYPHFKVKRSVLIIVKTDYNYLSRTITLLTPYTFQKSFYKKKFIVKKGFFQMNINMPSNYFLYNDEVRYNIHLDFRTLQINASKIKVKFYRKTKKNYRSNLLRTRRELKEEIFYKIYNLDKNLKQFDITDHFVFSDIPKQNRVVCTSPSEIYQKMEIHGLYELNDHGINSLYPSCSEGLIQIEYSLKFKVYLDSIFTTNEEVLLPINFCDIIDNNIPNEFSEQNMNNYININKNNIQNINQILPQKNFQSNIINNNNEINNNNIIENEYPAPPTLNSQNIDNKKNYREDNEALKDWVIIDK